MHCFVVFGFKVDIMICKQIHYFALSCSILYVKGQLLQAKQVVFVFVLRSCWIWIPRQVKTSVLHVLINIRAQIEPDRFSAEESRQSLLLSSGKAPVTSVSFYCHLLSELILLCQ